MAALPEVSRPRPRPNRGENNVCRRVEAVLRYNAEDRARPLLGSDVRIGFCEGNVGRRLDKYVFAGPERLYRNLAVGSSRSTDGYGVELNVREGIGKSAVGAGTMQRSKTPRPGYVRIATATNSSSSCN
nr:hypothetical protein [Arthrobacter sp. B6]